MDGQSLVLQCQFDVHPMQEATWFHEDQPVRENEDITIYQDVEGVCELRIAEVFPEDAGLYVCRLENVYGIAETRCQVTVEGMFTYLLTVFELFILINEINDNSINQH